MSETSARNGDTIPIATAAPISLNFDYRYTRVSLYRDMSHLAYHLGLENPRVHALFCKSNSANYARDATSYDSDVKWPFYALLRHHRGVSVVRRI